MRQVEKEGYHWAQLGLFDQDSAAANLRTWSRRRQKMGAYMKGDAAAVLPAAMKRRAASYRQ